MASSTVAAPLRFWVAQQRGLLLAANITISPSAKKAATAKLKWDTYITPNET
jgi:hypothetical protein